MRTTSKFSLKIIFSALLFSVLFVTETSAQLQEILKRMDAHQKSLNTLRSKVKMQNYNDQLKESDVIEGTAIYIRRQDNKINGRIDWVKPVQESLVLIDNQFVLYRPRLHQAILGSLDKKVGNPAVINQLSFLSMSKQDLKANYSIIYTGNEKIKGEVETVHLELKPKIITVFKSAELWVDKNGMPVQVKVIETNNDFVTVLLFDFEKNVAVKPSELKLELPANTKIIKDSGNICVCPQPDNPKDALKNEYNAVFSGKVIAVKDNNYTFQTEKVWKDLVDSETTVESRTTYDLCAPKLTAGERYIVFARKIIYKDKPILFLMPCSPTDILTSENGKKILKEIGKGKSVKKKNVGKKRKSVKKR